MSTTVWLGLTSFEKIGGQWILRGASNFSNLLAPWASGSRSLMLRAAALDISTGPLARHTFQTAGPVRASTFYLSLARTGHLDICRATRFQIVVARTMKNHSMYFSRGRPSHISAVFALSFRDASVTRVGVRHVNQTHRRQCFDHAARDTSMRTSGMHPGRIRALFSAKHMYGMVSSILNSFAFWSVNL